MLTKQEARDVFEAQLAQSNAKLKAAQVVDSLFVGLSQVRDLLLDRIHEDVESNIGTDSLIAPVSVRAEFQQAVRALVEVEIYSSIVAADEITRGGYVKQTEDWLRDQIFHLRMGEGHHDQYQERVAYYRSATAEDRRLKFLTILQRAAPESARTPLVLFRLFPRAIRIVAAVAFNDPLRAQELRSEQSSFLPAIGDCFECHGRVLDNEETCHVCGNPVWKFDWLQAE